MSSVSSNTQVNIAIFFFMLCAPALADLAEARHAFESGNYTTALNEFTPLAKRGDAVAQFSLGLMYSQGHGVTKDYAEALRWCRLAAVQGLASAQYNLGTMYADGRG